MNKWLSIVHRKVEEHFSFLRDVYNFTIEVSSGGATETAVIFSSSISKVEILLFVMPIEGDSPWIMLRPAFGPDKGTTESMINIDKLIKIRCPQLRLTAKERKDEITVWKRYSDALKLHFVDLLTGEVELKDIVK